MRDNEERPVVARARAAWWSGRLLPLLLSTLGVVLILENAIWHSPTSLEARHLAAGLAHLRHGDFSLCRVNPPVVRLVAALPAAVFLDAHSGWDGVPERAGERSEFVVADQMVRLNGRCIFRMILLGRLACIVFYLAGCYAIWAWATGLYGSLSGNVALGMWVFSPFVLGHGALLTTDAHSAALGALAGYSFWLWTTAPSEQRAFVAGLVLGIAQASKFTLLVLYPAFAIVFCALMLGSRSRRRACCLAVGFAVLVFTSVLVVNAVYGFRDTLRPLGGFRFVSEFLTGSAQADGWGNRFAGGPAGAAPVPLPREFLEGLDVQKRDFEDGMASYLSGEWSERGWWYYYLYAIAVKLPVGALILLLMACWSALRRRCSDISPLGEITVLACCAAVLVCASWQRGFSVHARYILPALPFLFVWCGRAFTGVRRLRDAVVPISAFVWMATSSLSIYPHSLSYFNELAGGPENGSKHLLDSNISWGQDLFFLKEWLDRHPEVTDLQFAAYETVDPRLVGIQFRLPPLGPRSSASTNSCGCGRSCGPLPGWYAIDVNHLAGAYSFIPDGCGDSTLSRTKRQSYEYFKAFQPVDRVGYSIYLYHISKSEANEARARFGLEAIPAR